MKYTSHLKKGGLAGITLVNAFVAQEQRFDVYLRRSVDF